MRAWSARLSLREAWRRCFKGLNANNISALSGVPARPASTFGAHDRIRHKTSPGRPNMRVGFIGLGNMGGPMALNMIKAGHSLIVNDIRRTMAEPHLAGGAQWADTPGALAAKSELVLTSLPGPKEVEAVALGANGILSGIETGAVYADLSTNSPTVIRRIHEVFKAKGIAMLDAPVSGGIPGARK